MQGPSEESQLIAELKKQYDVEEVDPSKPITDKYDVLLAVQPSSFDPDAMDNFVAAVKAGSRRPCSRIRIHGRNCGRSGRHGATRSGRRAA